MSYQFYLDLPLLFDAPQLDTRCVRLKQAMPSLSWVKSSDASLSTLKALSSIKFARILDNLVLDDTYYLQQICWRAEWLRPLNFWSQLEQSPYDSLSREHLAALAPDTEQNVNHSALERSFKAAFQFFLHTELNDILLAAQANTTGKKSTLELALEYSNQLLCLVFGNVDKIANADTSTLRLNAIKQAKKLSRWMYASAEKFLSTSALKGLTITIGNKGQIVIGRNEFSRRPSRRSCPYSDLQFAA